MKTFTLLFLTAALAGQALAEVPEKAQLAGYRHLVTNSPFTNKPAAPRPAPEAEALQDYALGGVSPVPGGYRVTLLNRRKPEERIVLPGNADFTILSVRHIAGDPMATNVLLASGSRQGTVRFDPALLSLKSSAAGTPPSVPLQNGAVQNQPRPRVTPPTPDRGK